MLNLKSKTLKFSISGLRGYFPEDINPENIPKIVYAYHKTLPKGAIAVASDNRPTRDVMREITIGTLLALGRDVYSIGIVPTPSIKAFVKDNKLAGGLMISASHNPVRYNAFKFIKKDGYFFAEKENKKWLENLNTSAEWNLHSKQGKLFENKNQDAFDNHINQVLKNIPIDLVKLKKKKLKVAIDTVAACATYIIPELLTKLGVDFTSIYTEVESHFPRQAEPTPVALKKLKEFVVKENCDIGFAFDPDADRLAIVDNTGEAIGEEYTLPLSMLKALDYRSGSIVVNLSSSYLNQWVAEKFSRKFFKSKVGEANVLEKMMKIKAGFGGEGNGGVIDPKISSLGRDSLSGVVWILFLLSTEEKPLNEIIKTMPTLFMKKTKIENLSQKQLKAFYSKLEKEFKGWNFNHDDGLFISDKKGIPWIHLRPSNTEPIVRLMVEAESKKELNALISQINKVI